MVTIKQINEKEIAMRCHYAYRDRCREIPGAEFVRERKAWVAPIESLPNIQATFYGELYFQTPLWKLKGEKRPEKKEVEYLGPEPDLSELTLKPYKYQETGIKFMIDRLSNVGFVLNGDGVGLGKTIQSIGTIKWFVENRGARKILIICKKSIKTQWETEIRRIAGWNLVPIFVTGGTKKKRTKAYEGILEAPNGILITNYQNFLNDYDEINKTNYDICVIDEAHCVKTRDGKMNNLIGKTVCGKRTILLTGTPIMSRPDDIWGIINMVSPNYFGDYETFKARHIVTEFGIYGEQIIGAQHLDDLQEKIEKFLIMRTYDDVASEIEEEGGAAMPERKRTKWISCEMDATQKKMQAIIAELKEKQDERKRELIAMHGLTEDIKIEIEKMNEAGKMYLAALQFIADDPAVFRYLNPEKGFSKRLLSMVPKSYTMSPKTEALIDAVSEITDAGEKLIIFCQYATPARMLQDRLKAISGVNTVMYTGLENDEARERNLRAFKTDPEVNVLIGTGSMAEGLNLQVCRFCLEYEMADTFAIREQRIGRIQRLGSKYDAIKVVGFYTKDSRDTIKIANIVEDKMLSDALLRANVG